MLFLFFSQMGFASSYHPSSFDKRIDWITTTSPNIMICDDANVSKDLVINAIDFWKQFYSEYNETKIEESKCEFDNTKFINDTIFITGNIHFDEDNYYAMTYFQFFEKDSIVGIQAARIEIQPSHGDHYKLLLHELGHAIGVMHSRGDETHIMHFYVVENDNVRVH